VKRIIEMLMDVLGRNVDKADATNYSAEEIRRGRSRRRSGRGRLEEEEQPPLLTVESAARIIEELPSDVPRESARRIVRGTLAATGIEVSNLERFTRARASKLNWEIELARNRQKEIREKTEEAVRSLEQEIRKAKETCETILTEEEKKISSASSALKDVGRVRAFFDFPKVDGEETIGTDAQDTQPLDALRT
jgi:vacuolar-type H+-ATPase subunit H